MPCSPGRYGEYGQRSFESVCYWISFLARIELNAAEKTSRMTPPFGPALVTALFGGMRARDFIHYGMRSYHLQGMANQIFLLAADHGPDAKDRRV